LKRIPSDFKKVKIRHSTDCYEFIKNFYFDDIDLYESFFLLLLNRANNTIGFVKISQGGIAGTVVDIRLIAKYATETLSCSVVLAHNHPSGTVAPSQNDIELTKKVKKALSYFDITVLDHIVLAADTYYSFADENLM
jgi:DNA repair protein RadC